MDEELRSSCCFVKNPPRVPVSCSTLAHSARAEDGGAARASGAGCAHETSKFFLWRPVDSDSRDRSQSGHLKR